MCPVAWLAARGRRSLGTRLAPSQCVGLCVTGNGSTVGGSHNGSKQSTCQMRVIHAIIFGGGYLVPESIVACRAIVCLSLDGYTNTQSPTPSQRLFLFLLFCPPSRSSCRLSSVLLPRSQSSPLCHLCHRFVSPPSADHIGGKVTIPTPTGPNSASECESRSATARCPLPFWAHLPSLPLSFLSVDLGLSLGLSPPSLEATYGIHHPT